MGKTKTNYGLCLESEGTVVYRHPDCKDGLKTTLDGITTLADVMPKLAKTLPNKPCYGSRPVIQTENIKDVSTGKVLEKVTLGPYKWQSYQAVASRVKNLGSGFLGLGLKSGDHMCIYMNTCIEWQLSSHAAFSIGATVVTAYATLGEEALVHALNETEVGTIVTEQALVPILRRIMVQLPLLKNIVVFGTGENLSQGFHESVKVLKLSEVEQSGATHKQAGPRPQPEDTAVIMYTSGSTGMPKGVVLTHKAVIAGVVGIGKSLPDVSPGIDTFLGFLPLAHILAMAAEMFITSAGVAVGYGSPSTLTDNSPRIKSGTKGDITALRPTFMVAVPAVVERIRSAVMGKIQTSPGLVKTLFWSGHNAKAAAWMKNESSPIWDAILFSKFKAILGM